VDAFRKAGCTVERMDQPCDLLVGLNGVNRLVEVKTGTKGYGAGLNDNQARWAEGWRGGEIYVVRTDDEALCLVNQWRAERGGL